MNHRERFLRTMSFQEVDRIPDYEFGYWDETIEAWHTQGLPSGLKNSRDVELHFGLEGLERCENLPIAIGIWPIPPGRILKEENGNQLIDDGIGGIYLKKRWPYASVPHYIRYPIRNKQDWERLRPFLDPETPGRFALLWHEVTETYKERDYPLRVPAGSLYGWLRNWMGVERLSLAFYREPEWVEDMMDTLTNLWARLYEKALKNVRADYATWWEDMCYNRGPLLSVRLFDEFMVPRYRKLTDLLKSFGVEINALDCDGNIMDLVPGWLRGGINCMYPLEAAHTDSFELRRKYGRKILLMGGVNKLALMGSKKTIDEELARLKLLVDDGGYIPTVDHRVPPEVTLENYAYYLNAKRRLIGRTDI